MRCSPRHPSCTPSHCALVEDYRAAREADLQDLERRTALYAAEVREFRQRKPALTFKDWLIGAAHRYAHTVEYPPR